MESRKNGVDIAAQLGTSLLEGLASISQQRIEDGSSLALKAADYGDALDLLSHAVHSQPHATEHKKKRLRRVK